MSSGATKKQAQAIADARTVMCRTATMLQLAAKHITSDFGTSDGCDIGWPMYFWAHQMTEHANKLWCASENAHDAFAYLFEHPWTADGVHRLKGSDDEAEGDTILVLGDVDDGPIESDDE